jgi:g-D-glutamyl-meso-diaminopimelate peptidase
MTSLLALRFAELLLRSRLCGKQIFGIDTACISREVIIVPCVNPDGVEISTHGAEGARGLRDFVSSIECEDYSKWNANALGVDINHNFNAGWDKLRQMEAEEGISSPSPRRFGGKFPESEAETRTLTRLCRMKRFRSVMALHSQGEELFWQYGEKTPKSSQIMAKILSDSCGYRLIDNFGLCSHGGFKDWFIEEFSQPGFTMEIGKGENPLPKEMLYEIYERIEEALLLFCLM